MRLNLNVSYICTCTLGSKPLGKKLHERSLLQGKLSLLDPETIRQLTLFLFYCNSKLTVLKLMGDLPTQQPEDTNIRQSQPIHAQYEIKGK